MPQTAIPATGNKAQANAGKGQAQVQQPQAQNATAAIASMVAKQQVIPTQQAGAAPMVLGQIGESILIYICIL